MTKHFKIHTYSGTSEIIFCLHDTKMTKLIARKRTCEASKSFRKPTNVHFSDMKTPLNFPLSYWSNFPVNCHSMFCQLKAFSQQTNIKRAKDRQRDMTKMLISLLENLWKIGKLKNWFLKKINNFFFLIKLCSLEKALKSFSVAAIFLNKRVKLTLIVECLCLFRWLWQRREMERERERERDMKNLIISSSSRFFTFFFSLSPSLTHSLH